VTFNDDLTANLVTTVQVEGFWKSVNLWRGYGQT